MYKKHQLKRRSEPKWPGLIVPGGNGPWLFPEPVENPPALETPGSSWASRPWAGDYDPQISAWGRSTFQAVKPLPPSCRCCQVTWPQSLRWSQLPAVAHRPSVAPGRLSLESPLSSGVQSLLTLLPTCLPAIAPSSARLTPPLPTSLLWHPASPKVSLHPRLAGVCPSPRATSPPSQLSEVTP